MDFSTYKKEIEALEKFQQRLLISSLYLFIVCSQYLIMFDDCLCGHLDKPNQKPHERIFQIETHSLFKDIDFEYRVQISTESRNLLEQNYSSITKG